MEGEQAASPYSGGVPTPDCGGGHVRHSSPLPREVLAFRVSISPVAGSRPLGLRSFLKVRARALWSPPQKWKPREPRHHPPRALLAHLIEGRRARGRAEGSPAEKSPSACGRRLHDGAGSDWVRLPRAGAGPGGSERGHPTVAEQTGPLSLCMGGRSHVPTDGYLDQSQLQADLA